LKNNILFILLDGQGGNMSFLLTMGAVFLVMYFFMMRPQQKKQKDQKKFLEEMKKGDAVVTIGGLHGKIHELDDLTLILEVDRGIRMKFDRSSISMEASMRAKKEAETAA
jgi:preprotein translocase subunit YajC